MNPYVFYIENLGCANCAAKMEERIQKLPHVQKASITFATRQLRVTTTESREVILPQLQKIVSDIEGDAKVVDTQPHRHSEECGCGEHHHHHHHDHCDCEEHTHKPKHPDGELLRLIGGAVLFALGLVLQGLNVSLPAIIVFGGAYLLLGLEILITAVKNLFKGHVFDENFLMSIATLGAFGIREYPEAVGIMLFYRAGEYFEHKAVERSRSQIMAAVDLRPETVTRLNGDTAETIPAAQAQVGDVLLVRPGDRIPLDGTVISGTSRIDTSPITGEPVPVGVQPGSAVTSGCVNTTGQLTLRVDQHLSQSMVTRILEYVEEAAAGKPRLDRFITRFARIYTPVVVFGAVAVAVIPSLLTGNWGYWVYTALSFLVMSCPCALVLSVPLAFFSGIGVGCRKGILFKGGSVMEAMGKIRVVVMDKTGTLTKGDFSVQRRSGDEELLRLCASCEQYSTHPIAQSILQAAEGMVLYSVSEVQELPGHGVCATVQGSRVLCGNEKLLKTHGIDVPEDTQAGTRVLVARDGVYLGSILISDTLKEDAGAAVAHLHAMGITTAMLTGDAGETAEAVAKKVGIRRVFARLLPQEKLEALRSLRSELGGAMFVGDGINDAPVLAGADVGAAMGSGADAAIEAADVVFLNSRVSAIPDALETAKKTRRIAVQNVVFALTVKAVVMLLGLFGYASLWAAVFADSGVAALCVLNSLRMLYRKG